MSADHAVLAHHALALVNRLAVPVLSLAAGFIHWVKTEITAPRDFRPEARGRGFALLDELRVDFAVPLCRTRLQSFRGQLGIEVDRGFVQTQFDDRDIRG